MGIRARLQADELLGRALFELIHADDLVRTQEAVEGHFGEGGQVLAFQNRYRHRYGAYRWLEGMSRTTSDNSPRATTAVA